MATSIQSQLLCAYSSLTLAVNVSELELIGRSLLASHYPEGTTGFNILRQLDAVEGLLSSWQTNKLLHLASLYSCVYTPDWTGTAVVPVTMRSKVRVLSGARVERLAILRSRLDLTRLLRDLKNHHSPVVLVERALSSNPGDFSSIVTKADAEDLLTLAAATLLVGAAGRMTGPVCSLASTAGVLSILKSGGVSTRTHLKCLAGITEQTETLACHLYSQAIAEVSRNITVACRLFHEVHILVPFLFEPLAWLAYGHLELNAPREVISSFLEAALLLQKEWQVCWDNRLMLSEWQMLLTELQHQNLCREARPAEAIIDEPRLLFSHVIGRTREDDDIDKGMRGSTMAAYPDGSPSISPRSGSPSLLPEQRRLLRFMEAFSASPSGTTHGLVYPELHSTPWLDASLFTITGALEGAYESILAEMQAIDNQPFQVEGEPIGRKGLWEVLFMYERGRRNDSVCAKLPTLTRIVEESVETIRGLAGLVYLSRLRPGTEIQGHNGPTNLRVRCHLGLRVPSGDCGISVNGEHRQWQAGKCIVLNDYLHHEAWNRTTQDRLVVIVDLWHPDLTRLERQILEGFHSYMSRQAMNLQSYWNMNERNRLASD